MKSITISEQSSKLTSLLEQAFERAVLRGQKQLLINSAHKPKALASFLMTILHGIHIRAKTNKHIRINLKDILPMIKLSLE